MSNQTRVRKAVFLLQAWAPVFCPPPRLRPEMLPVVDKPLIQYAVEEAYEAGIRDMVFVTGRSKRAIEDHFDTAYELENELENAGKQAMLDLVRSVSPADMNCLFVRQPRSLGLGHAVLCEPGGQRTLCRLADDLMTGENGGPGVMAQMTAASRSRAARCWPCRKSAEHTKRYGIVKGEPAGGR
jgi:UTP--glucose-1-phosphate uridylyltransferase